VAGRGEKGRDTDKGEGEDEGGEEDREFEGGCAEEGSVSRSERGGGGKERAYFDKRSYRDRRCELKGWKALPATRKKNSVNVVVLVEMARKRTITNATSAACTQSSIAAVAVSCVRPCALISRT